MRNDSDLFFTCSLIELIGRTQKLPRSAVVEQIGEKTLRRIYSHADVLHCEPIAKVAEDFIEQCGIPAGDYDNVGRCCYEVPSYWTIGKVYARLIEDVQGEQDVIDTLRQVYASWISESISDYNADFFYQPRDYLRECWREDKVL